MLFNVHIMLTASCLCRIYAPFAYAPGKVRWCASLSFTKYIKITHIF